MGPEILDNLESMVASALDVAPNAAEMQEKARFVAAYVASSAAARVTQRYLHLTPASLDSTIQLLDNRPIRRAAGDNLETPDGRNS